MLARGASTVYTVNVNPSIISSKCILYNIDKIFGHDFLELLSPLKLSEWIATLCSSTQWVGRWSSVGALASEDLTIDSATTHKI